MPANHRVSVAWQIVFTFLPIVNFWAFYRIRKLRKYLCVFVPMIVLAYLANSWLGALLSSFLQPYDIAVDPYQTEKKLPSEQVKALLGVDVSDEKLAMLQHIMQATLAKPDAMQKLVKAISVCE